MNHKRRKPRTQVRCRLCTDARNGNSLKDARRQDRVREIEKRESTREA
jgi:hypothetical protein